MQQCGHGNIQKEVSQSQGGRSCLAVSAIDSGRIGRDLPKGDQAGQETGHHVSPQRHRPPLFLSRGRKWTITRFRRGLQRRQVQERAKDSEQARHLPAGTDLLHAALGRTHQGRHLDHRVGPHLQEWPGRACSRRFLLFDQPVARSGHGTRRQIPKRKKP